MATTKVESPPADDGIDLVKEVLDENPPEERGVRDEWDHQVGWHRKENIHGASPQLRGSNDASFHNKQSLQQEIRHGLVPTETSRTSMAIAVLLLMACCAATTRMRHQIFAGTRTKSR